MAYRHTDMQAYRHTGTPEDSPYRHTGILADRHTAIQADRQVGIVKQGSVIREWGAPGDLGLPQGEFRPVQEYALRVLEQSDKRFLLVQAPTGSGKSLIAAAIGRILGVRMVYMAPTKGLQDQFTASFPHAVQVKGRDNYPTAGRPDLFPDVTCADCDKRARGRDGDGRRRCSWCPDVNFCPYEQAKRAALASDAAVVNLAYFLTEANHAGRFSGWQLAVVDEADELERALMDHIAVEFPERLLGELGVRPPEGRGAAGTATTEAGLRRKLSIWGDWLGDRVSPALERRIAELADLCRRLRGRDDVRYAKTFRHLQALQRKRDAVALMLADLAESPESWVRVDDRGLVFKPVRVDRHAHAHLWRHAERWLLMSATIISPDQFCADLGLDAADVEWVELPSTFPVPNRPVYYWPAASVTHRTQAEALPRLVDALDQLLDRYPCRALVHTHTYDIARYVVANSRHRERMVAYEPGHRDEALEAFKRLRLLGGAGGVLVAPSLERGVSLDDDLARLVVVLKVPYPNLGDRQVAARFRDGTGWYPVQTVRALVQMTGRGVRSETDWCDTWILDGEFGRLWRRSWHLFPDWWREAVTTNPGAVRAALERGGKRNAG